MKKAQLRLDLNNQDAIVFLVFAVVIVVYLVSMFLNPGRVDPDATPSWSHGHASSD